MARRNEGSPLDLLAAIAPASAASLIVEVSGTEPHSYDLTADEIRLGRADDNDIVVPAPYVSRHQAVLRRGPEGYTIEVPDEAGNPVILAGRRLTARAPLKSGDLFRVSGRAGEIVTFRFLDAPRNAPREGRLPINDGTVIRIGSAADNDLGIGGLVLEPYHGRIECRGDRIWLEPLKGVTHVNDAVITEPIGLNAGDLVRLGGVRIVVEDDALEFQDRTSALLVPSRRARTIPEDIAAERSNTGGILVEARHLRKQIRGVDLLQDVSLRIRPGELVVLLGLSGAGKSTLMNALAGYAPATAGDVYVDGTNLYDNFGVIRPGIGFVPQRDIIHMDLTVFEALDYAARLRMAPGTPEEARHHRVDEVLADLDLCERRDVRVRALSGGQQKRVSIGVELITSPQLFFLDEPTSGLDPGTETELMQLLRRMADQGRTIIVITHATKNVMLADKAIFMVRGGRVAWFGRPREALEHFDRFRSERDRLDQPLEFDAIYPLLENPALGTPEVWEERYRADPAHDKYVRSPLRLDDASGPTPGRPAPTPPPQLSWFGQLLVLSARNLTLLLRDRFALALMLLAAPILASLDFFITTRDMYDPLHGDPLRITIGLGTMVVNAMLVGALSQTREVIKDKDIYRRERLVNLGVLPYVLSKFWVAGLLAVYQSLAWIGIWYLAVAMPGSFAEAAALCVTMFLAILAGMMLGLLASAVAPTEDSVTLIVALLIVPQVLFNGSLLPLPKFALPARAVTAAMPARWAFESLLTQTHVGADVHSAHCHGVSLLTQCTFPGIRSYYTPAVVQPRPRQPEAPHTAAILTRRESLAPDLATARMQMQALRQGVAGYLRDQERYAGAMRHYQHAYARWTAARQEPIARAEATLSAEVANFGGVYDVNVPVHWTILTGMILALLGFIVGIQRAKDAV